MAGLPCDLCSEEAAAMLMTNVATGDVLGVGETCLFAFYVGAAGGLTEGMAPEVKAAYRDVVGELAAVIGATAPPPAAAPTRTRKAKPPAGGGDGQGGGGDAASEPAMDENPVTGDMEPVTP